ncbi:exonuclease domain-containing protein [Chitinibacter sp. ZOR0017]|uniref:exonuclease domain-containing protein n=1 Tax=Chitinibacter sp. ZOR0017 TaxID=1339254 RepID=UPI000646FAF0|nr:exonuclease domain-containing protein [Chitinibacter sp. ZOR0017]
MSHPIYPAPLVLLDLETTGAKPAVDRITEIGLLQLDTDGGIERWSSLVNPEQPIPQFIQQLTGIDDAMVRDAPRFAAVASDLLAKLQGRIFVAHNARFDYTFLRNEFQRLGLLFRAKVLCTVQLSRKLYPDEFKHSLDALITRHGLQYNGERHRALTDAELVQQFLSAAVAELGAARVQQAIDELIRPPALPSQLDESQVDDLPDTAGVYLFYGANDVPLYVGAASNLRRRILQHFGKKATDGQAAQLAAALQRIDWIETSGELGASLREQRLLRELKPRFNPGARQKADQTQVVWSLTLNPAQPEAPLQPQLITLGELRSPHGELFGPFRGAREAQNILNRIAKGQGLCRQLLGLEKARKGNEVSPCSALSTGDCRGGCVGREPVSLHNARLLAALAKHKVTPWPYDGPILLAEGPSWAPVWQVLDQWVYLGEVSSQDQLDELLSAPYPAYDLDMAKQIRALLRKPLALTVYQPGMQLPQTE